MNLRAKSIYFDFPEKGTDEFVAKQHRSYVYVCSKPTRVLGVELRMQRPKFEDLDALWIESIKTGHTENLVQPIPLEIFRKTHLQTAANGKKLHFAPIDLCTMGGVGQGFLIDVKNRFDRPMPLVLRCHAIVASD